MRGRAHDDRSAWPVSKPIPVRLGDDDIEVLDQLVRLGLAANRSDAIKRGIDRDRRRLAAMRDAAAYARSGEDPDLVAFTRSVARTPPTERD
jgi:Arc/MetJ-type ribon-helix-helix transcriptional regulator